MPPQLLAFGSEVAPILERLDNPGLLVYEEGVVG